MELMNKAAFIILLIFGITACGVKGRPLPPQDPPPIGNGEPTYLNKKDDKKTIQKR